MSSDIYRDLRAKAEGQVALQWLLPLIEQSQHELDASRHGDMPRWRAALDRLPPAEPLLDGSAEAPVLGRPVADQSRLKASLMDLHPWRKGPLDVGGQFIDTEWRSDWKWSRLAPHLELSDRLVLDVGCGNGYYGWRMLGAGADCVVGLDPTLVFVMQWLAARHYSGAVNNFVLPLGIEALPEARRCFDTVFSMGVLYHRKDACGHLRHLFGQVKPGGQLVLETLVLEGDEERELRPQGRYARMRNVWSVPSVPRLQRWLRQAGLPAGRVLDVTPTSETEQRSTEWMTFESLRECLDPEDPRKTVEGHPAPLRACLLVDVPA